MKIKRKKILFKLTLKAFAWIKFQTKISTAVKEILMSFKTALIRKKLIEINMIFSKIRIIK